MRLTHIAICLALAGLVLAPALVLAEEPPGKDDGKTPPGLKPAGKKPEKTEAERREDLKRQKAAFFKMFKDRLEDMETNQDVPEKEEIGRLTDLKSDYKSKLKKAKENLSRAKSIVQRSFMGLIKSNQPRETVEQRCENIWLDYMANSRRYKMQVSEYTRALDGVEKRIKYIRRRLATRDYPTAEKGEKYYLSDPIELYKDPIDLGDPGQGGNKSEVSYYALLKDFVMGILGKGRADMSKIAGRLNEPPGQAWYRQWLSRNRAAAPAKGSGKEGTP